MFHNGQRACLPLVPQGKLSTTPKDSHHANILKEEAQNEGQTGLCSQHTRDQDTQGEFSLNEAGGPGLLRTPRAREPPRSGRMGARGKEQILQRDK